MARKTPQRPRSPQSRRPQSAAPEAAPVRVPRAPRVPNPAAAMASVDYESDLAERYRHVRRDLMRILVIGLVMFAIIAAARMWSLQSGGQLFFTF